MDSNTKVEITSFPVAPLGCNCSILRCKETNEAIVVDPGGEAEKIIQILKEQNCRVKHIIHTHAHFDHILGTDDVASFCNQHHSTEHKNDADDNESSTTHTSPTKSEPGSIDAKPGQAPKPQQPILTEIGLHKGDDFLYNQLEAQCRMFGVPTATMKTQINHWLEDNEILTFGNSKLNILHTPGHTPGSCSFHLPEQELLFSGDTLFSRSIGRTDFPGGDSGLIIRSIRERLFTLDDATNVIPGHGEVTRIYEEKKENPFF